MNHITPEQRSLTSAEFYLLLAAYMTSGHAYNLRGRMAVLSQGMVNISSGAFTALRVRLQDLGYIEFLGKEPTGKSGMMRRQYGISEYGIIRLKEELVRLHYAVKIAENTGLLDDDIPLDIQRLKLEASIASQSVPSQR